MWASRHNKNTAGFTIIEIVLVLAIAALLFLIVFLALPTLQRSQRDATRRNSLAAIASLTEAYRTANEGQKLCFDSSSLPPTWCGNQSIGYNASYTSFITNYLKMEHRAPDTFASVTTQVYGFLKTHTVAYTSDAWLGATYPPGMIVFAAGAQCTGGRIVFDPANTTNQLVVWIKTELGVGVCREV